MKKLSTITAVALAHEKVLLAAQCLRDASALLDKRSIPQAEALAVFVDTIVATKLSTQLTTALNDALEKHEAVSIN